MLLEESRLLCDYAEPTHELPERNFSLARLDAQVAPRRQLKPQGRSCISMYLFRWTIDSGVWEEILENAAVWCRKLFFDGNQFFTPTIDQRGAASSN